MSGGVISSALTVRAEELTYSNVLDDLQKDPTFDAATYPDNPEDVSVKLIQIAESDGGQLFLYVYQPSNDTIDLKCTSVSISVGFSSNGQGLSPQFYDLILVSTEGVFDKYLVNGFILPDEAERYYNIVQILREFNAAVDPESDKTEYKDTVCKSYAVGQQWCAYTLNDKLVYEMNTFNTIKLDIVCSATVRVKERITFNNLFGVSSASDIHIVAFKCDEYVIKHIYDAYVEFLRIPYSHFIPTQAGMEEIYTENFDNAEPDDITLTDSSRTEIVGTGLGGKNVSWGRILKKEDFVNKVLENDGKFKDGALDALGEAEWVFSYEETPVSSSSEGNWYVTEGYVTQGNILRIHFMDIHDNIYDLGVVSDTFKTSGTLAGIDSDFDDFLKDIENIFYKILALICIIVILILLFTAFPVIKAVFSGFAFIFKMLWDLLTLPFRWIFKK